MADDFDKEFLRQGILSKTKDSWYEYDGWNWDVCYMTIEIFPGAMNNGNMQLFKEEFHRFFLGLKSADSAKSPLEQQFEKLGIFDPRITETVDEKVNKNTIYKNEKQTHQVVINQLVNDFAFSKNCHIYLSTQPSVRIPSWDEKGIWIDRNEAYKIEIQVYDNTQLVEFLMFLEEFDSRDYPEITIKGFAKMYENQQETMVCYEFGSQSAGVVTFSRENPETASNWLEGYCEDCDCELDYFALHYETKSDDIWSMLLPHAMQIAALNCEDANHQDWSLYQKVTNSITNEKALEMINERYVEFGRVFKVKAKDKALLFSSLQSILTIIYKNKECFIDFGFEEMRFFNQDHYCLENWKVNIQTGELKAFHTKILV